MKETIFFELELLKNLSDIKISSTYNLETKQLDFLKIFLKNKPFKVVELDKNVGVGLISNDLYLELANHIFDNNLIYEKISDNPLKTAIDYIESELIILLENKNISQKLFNNIVPNQNNKLGKARILPKIHKANFSSDKL